MKNTAQKKYRASRKIFIGDVAIGAGSPVAVQSMTKTKTTDIAATVSQIKALEDVGCEMIRVAVPDLHAAQALSAIKARLKIPLIADIHFDYRLALKAMEAGADKIRINPGNIGSLPRLKEIVSAAKMRQIPIRIGVNAGSLEKDIFEKYGEICAPALVESALRHVSTFQDFGFDDIVISLKASDVKLMIESYQQIAAVVDFPLHLGVTEAGTYQVAAIKSAVGIGTLLAEGIGDTIRVSITGDPLSEVWTGYQILKSLGLRQHGLTIISCPTCGRLQVDLVSITRQVEERLAMVHKNLKVAIMGCTVNGPGEAREADLGIACGKNSALLFKKGKIIRKLREAEIIDALVAEVSNWDEPGNGHDLKISHSNPNWTTAADSDWLGQVNAETSFTSTL
ncbi:flavodoxin-dependent (E)-4-hydroxy-3-methylbut-2-enyl-diphosphate synthase [candidate division KSB1 bacterium]|nr:flavodoxin-dependent (E)-4-hydroxy-3-methylbut-2-enyl-diphosphate synthase [candidate division KSB1 bacterium]